MRNTALVTFVESGCVEDVKHGVANGCVVGIISESAALGSARHFGDVLAHNQVDEGTLSRARFAENDNVMHETLTHEEVGQLFRRNYLTTYIGVALSRGVGIVCSLRCFQTIPHATDTLGV